MSVTERFVVGVSPVSMPEIGTRGMKAEGVSIQGGVV